MTINIPATVPVGALTVGIGRDRRPHPPSRGGVLSINGAALPASGEVGPRIGAAAATGVQLIVDKELGLVLPPDSAAGISNFTDNTEIIASWWWRERTALPGEILNQ